jgi:hypothetical protein
MDILRALYGSSKSARTLWPLVHARRLAAELLLADVLRHRVPASLFLSSRFVAFLAADAQKGVIW